jgi:hypothetical protein
MEKGSFELLGANGRIIVENSEFSGGFGWLLWGLWENLSIDIRGSHKEVYLTLWQSAKRFESIYDS